MRCPSCAAPNAAGGRFCASCGFRLTSSCPYCSAEVAADQRFCGNCGGLLADRGGDRDDETRDAQTRSERRLISVLFVDLENFSGLTEALDPEDVRAIQAEYFELARSVVRRYGGMLEKFIGDAVMALWGAPQAHEDDAERAVRAALELVAGVGRLPARADVRLRARAAVATGEAAVTLGVDGQGMVSGDLVNTAARLQQIAPPGGLLVDETTRRLVAEVIVLEPAGTTALKGKRQPVTAWHVRGVAGSAEVGRAAGHPGRFVGREAEIAELAELFARTAAGPRSRLVSLLGIAGIGKSRLAWEFERHLGGLAAPPLVFVGRSPSYGEGITFAPLTQIVRRYARIEERASSAVVRTRLAAALRATLPDARERGWLEPRLATLLDPAGEHFEADELFAAWRRFFDHLSRTSPTVLVFEDLQWADDALLDFIEYLAAWSRDRPLLIMTLARPELLDRRPTWGADQHDFTALRVAPLSDAAMTDLLRGLVPDLEAKALGQIVDRAGGVPLYGVEVARMLVAGEPLDLDDMPPSLHALVAARIDALPAAPRRLLLSAAVLGRRLDTAALAAVNAVKETAIRQPLALLVRRELLTVDDEPGSPGLGQLAFVQDIVREVAYRTLSRAQRRTLHLAAAEHLGGRSDDELIEARAEHLVRGYEAAPDHPQAPAIRLSALAAQRGAAARARALHAPGRALQHLQQALALTDDELVVAELRQEAAGTAREAARFDVAEQYLRELIKWYEGRQERHEHARARAQLASLLLATERHRSALVDLEAALRSMVDLDADPAGVELAGQLARGRVLVGQDEEGLLWSERTLVAARRLDLRPVAIDALTTRGTARLRLADRQAGEADLRAAIDEAAQLGLLRAELRARNNLAWLSVMDAPHATLDTARAGMTLASEMGIADMALQLGLVAATVALETGHWDYAFAVIDEVRDRPQATAHQIQFAAIEATLRALRGEAEATGVLDRLLPLDEETDPQIVAAAGVARAWIAFAENRFGDAEREAAAASEQLLGADRQSALLLAGRSALWHGDVEAAGRALAGLKEMKATGRVTLAAQTSLRAGCAALGGDEDAAALYEEALRRWRQLELPLHLGICLLERNRLLGGEQSEARDILGRLGAHGLLPLSGSAA